MKELLQFQMMQMLNPAAANNGGGGQGGSAGGGDIKQTVYLVLLQMVSFLFLGLVEQVSKAAPTLILEFRKRYFDSKIEKTLHNMKKETLADVSIGLNARHDQSTVIIIRRWAGQDSSSSSKSGSDSSADESKEIADALLSHIALAQNVPTLQLIQSSQFIINYLEKPVEIADAIFIKIDDFRMDPETLKMNHIVFRITSNTHSTKGIRVFLETIRKQYIADQQNKLGDSIWYFEQKIRASRSSSFNPNAGTHSARMERILNAPPVIKYEMRPFHTNKSFDNLYGDEARLIRDRIDFFMEKPGWYAEKGLPHQLGILLSGKPGTGKTAILRAIANRTKRHIINLKLSNIATATQLKNIFYNDYVTVSMDETGHETKKLLIPSDKRIYVFEEIDTVGALIQERSLQGDVGETVMQDELTLGDILQILDGTIEIPGRILIMTSNFPERLDRALLRPGRIDVKCDFGFSTAQTIAETVKGLLDYSVPKDRLPDRKLTVAEVLNVVFNFIHAKGDFTDEIVDRLNARVKELEAEEARLKRMQEESRLTRLAMIADSEAESCSDDDGGEVVVSLKSLHERGEEEIPDHGEIENVDEQTTSTSTSTSASKGKRKKKSKKKKHRVADKVSDGWDLGLNEFPNSDPVMREPNVYSGTRNAIKIGFDTEQDESKSSKEAVPAFWVQDTGIPPTSLNSTCPY